MNGHAYEINIREEGERVSCPVTLGILQTINLKGEALFAHSVMVGTLAELVGTSLGLDSRSIAVLKIAGLLHDIGKIAISNEILLKPSQLNKREMEQIRAHPEQGAKALARLEGFGQIAKIVLYHHEADNGEGYPHGLKGDQIPLESKIIRFCDMYSAMTSERPYKPSYSHRHALQLSIEAFSVPAHDRRIVQGVLDGVMVVKGV
ncbi:MAG: HD-GYP domain-containing protein [Thermodesulfovibrionales bacterium]